MSSNDSQLPTTNQAQPDPFARDRMSDDQLNAWLKEMTENEEASATPSRYKPVKEMAQNEEAPWTTVPFRPKLVKKMAQNEEAPGTATPSRRKPTSQFSRPSSGDLPATHAKKQKSSSYLPPTPAETPANRRSSKRRSPSSSPTPSDRAVLSKKRKAPAETPANRSGRTPSSPSPAPSGRAVLSKKRKSPAETSANRSRSSSPERTVVKKARRVTIVISSSESENEGNPSSSAGGPSSRPATDLNANAQEKDDESDDDDLDRGAKPKTKRGEAITTGIYAAKAMEAEDLNGAIYRREHVGGETTLEIAFPAGPIMRRSDGWVNVTKLFSVLLGQVSNAAASWARRQSFKVDSVSKGTLVGKWVSADVAASFAERRKITEEVAPLLAVDMRPEIIKAFPTKDEILANLPGGGQNALRIKERDRKQALLSTRKYRENKKQRRD
ncbi:hypothetical protein HDU86_006227 [Geranomyces michiganensis]|nr:hypothetical protein HDU86_006227 [Geranomyces michiganensis]